MPNLRVRNAESADSTHWHHLRCELWPGRDAAHEREIQVYFESGLPGLDGVLVAESAESASRIVGFAELSLRHYAEGCTSSPVGYLEGWFVVPGARSAGVGRALVAAAEEWARERGCSEFASDTEAENEDSRSAHLHCDFDEVGLIRCFRKVL